MRTSAMLSAMALWCAVVSVPCSARAAGTAFTYQGQLENSGSPANGTFDVQFALFDAALGGTQIGPVLCADNLQVTSGQFTTAIDFGAAFGGPRWLEIRVRADTTAGNCASGTFTTLSPRQAVTPAPSATTAHSAEVLDAPLPGAPDAVVVSSSGLVGIGTGAATPSFSLEVATPSPIFSKPSIGVSDGTSAWAYLHGSSNAPGHSLVWDDAHPLRFGTESVRGSGYVERMRISPAGFLGIGTNNPQGPLDVSVPGTGFVRVDSNGDFVFNGGSDGSFGFKNVSTASGAFTGIFDGADTPLLLVKNDGRVGVGTANPQSALDVRGQFRVASPSGIQVLSATNNNGTDELRFGPTGSQIVMFGTSGDASLSVGLAQLNSNGLIVASTINSGTINATVKNFRIPNPSEPGTDIVYACVEGPEAAAYVRGTVQLEHGEARISFPQHFIDVASEDGMTVQLTPRSAESLGLAAIELAPTHLAIKELHGGTGAYKVDWEVKAVRKGFEDYQAVRPSERMLPK